MKPYEDAFILYQQAVDRSSYSMGIYVNRAVMVAIDKCFNGKKSKLEYFEEPLLRDINLTQEEIDNRELQKMIAQERLNIELDKAKGLKPPT